MESNPSYRGVLGNIQFRRLWSAAFFARVGEAIGLVAMPLLVYDMTGSATLMSVIFIVRMLPQAILSPFSGVLADNFDRRKLMIGASVLRAIAVAFIPFATEPEQVAVIAAIAGLGTTLIIPAELAMLPTIVAPSQLVAALSATQVMSSVTRIAGPAVGAAIVGLAGPPPAFWAQAVCFVIAIGWLLFLRAPAGTASRLTSGALTDRIGMAAGEIGEGLRTIWRTPVVRGVCATEGLWSLVIAVFGVTMVLYTEETLDLGNRADFFYGMLAVTMSTGAVLGALLAGKVERRLGRPSLLAIGYLGPLLLIPAGLTPPLALLLGLWFAFGLLDAWAVIAMQAYLAESVPDKLRGRVYAIWGGIIALSALASYAVAGFLTEALGPPATVAVVGLVVGVGGPLALFATGAMQSVFGKSNLTPEPQSHANPDQV